MKYLVFIILALTSCAKSRRVSVTRGEFNQPAIRVLKAKDSADADYQVFAQQGFEQASDRLLQMDVLRRMAQGQLSELLGPKAVEKDTLSIAIGLKYAAQNSFEKIKEFADVMAALSAYADGVNRFISEMPARRPDLARIYRELARNEYTPRPWLPLDSVAMAESMAFFLSTSLEDKIQYGIYGVLTHGLNFESLPKKVASQFDLRPIENTFIIEKNGRASSPPVAETLPGKALSILAKVQVPCMRLGYPFPDCGKSAPLGSNNWVVSKKFAGQGATLLANDPHLPLTFPTLFYEMALDSKSAGGTIQVAGLHVPGGPGVMIGHNGQMGWGFTNLGADVDDVYFEELSEDGKSVRFKDTFVPLEIETLEIPVRLASGEVEQRKMTLRWVSHLYSGKESYLSHRRPIFSDHNPLMHQALSQIEEMTGLKYAISYRWAGHEGTTELKAVFAMNQAQTPDEMREAIRFFGAGTQNVVYADRFGNIGYMAHGKFPIRRYLSKDYPPFLPIIDHSDWDWDGFQSAVPEQINPARGFIVTANNDPWGDTLASGDYSRYLSFGFANGIRAKRITRLIEESRGQITTETMKRIQFDHQDLLALRFIDPIRGVNLKLSPKAQSFSDKLTQWDGLSSRNRFEPLLWNHVLQTMMRAHFGAKIPEGQSELFNLDEFIHSHPAVKTLYHKLADSLSAEATSPGFEEAKELWVKGLEGVAKEAGTSGIESKVWGEVARMSFTTPLEKIFPSFALFPVERDGTFDTVDVAFGAYGPNFRLILSLSEEGISAVNVLPGGNYSPTDTKRLYKELLMWRDGNYRPLIGF